MKISQPKFTKPMFTIKGVGVTTLREKNKITGWKVGKKEFPIKGTLLKTWLTVEKFINDHLL